MEEKYLFDSQLIGICFYLQNVIVSSVHNHIAKTRTERNEKVTELK